MRTGDKMKTPKKIKPEHVLCVSCKKPIHIKDFGAITKEGFWHNNAFCILDLIKLREEKTQPQEVEKTK